MSVPSGQPLANGAGGRLGDTLDMELGRTLLVWERQPRLLRRFWQIHAAPTARSASDEGSNTAAVEANRNPSAWKLI